MSRIVRINIVAVNATGSRHRVCRVGSEQHPFRTLTRGPSHGNLDCSAAPRPRLPDAAASAAGFFDFVETNVEAEALGFHSSFVTEHHFTKIGQLSAPLTLLTYLAARTTRLRLGTAILVLPWHNPVLLAEQVATLDLLSRGRLDLGIGKGYRHNEFAGFALPPGEAEPRFEEVLDVMVRALAANDPFSHNGRFFRFDEVVVEPPPYQRPHPPLWLAAGSAASITACARRGFNLLLDQFASPLQIKERIALYRRELEAAGHAFDPSAGRRRPQRLRGRGCRRGRTRARRRRGERARAPAVAVARIGKAGRARTSWATPRRWNAMRWR